MNGQEPERISRPAEGDQDAPEDRSNEPKSGWLRRAMETLAHLGIGEVAVRIGTNIISILLVILVVWLMRLLYARVVSPARSGGDITAIPTATPLFVAGSIPLTTGDSLEQGIGRKTTLHTSIPSRPRVEVLEYTVQSGDNVFGIAEKFNLNPSTVLFGNYDVLADNPHSIRPDQVLTILPVDGTYYEWQGTENLGTVAEFFGVDAETIINYPGNNLDPDAITDLADPGIPAGTWLIVPGGRRAFISWSAPIGVTRSNPAAATVIGVGSCGSIEGGAVGFGSFVWPTNEHWLSGNDYSPDSNHLGIDLAGDTGNAIYATDAGVIVYAGWNDWGYGEMIIIDHGNGWQSLYAHLSAYNVVCGQSVGQGEVIGAMGSTGNSTGSHLHFELMNTAYGKVNPRQYLP